ncbi:MAG TPA: hypothetical protein ENG83_12440 [Nitrospirae bacterium]|nr:fibronectin type III domain protein [bacterium BMS3Abin06]HDH12985.1 hypothetical protein [Nitrospirota bacterium]HDZ02954.1 hypothetical protein [Nitrospirota bacterium]
MMKKIIALTLAMLYVLTAAAFAEDHCENDEHAPPTATTDPATDITDNSAVLNATINPTGSETTAYFEWGTDISYGNSTPPQSITDGGDHCKGNDISITADITGFSPGTTYHYRVFATNEHGTTYGDDISLTTTGTLFAEVTGTITDASASLPLSGVSVTITDALNNIHTGTTDLNGEYTITDLAQGDFTSTFTKSGYISQTLNGLLVAGQTLTIDAALSPILPAIRDIAASNINTDSATITWITDQQADSLVEYGTTTSYGNSASDAAMVTSHSITLTGLVPGITYHFKIKSTNSYGFSSSSGDETFTTLSPITVTITSPLDNDTINRTDVMVKGTVSNTTGNETGVVINGIVAVVYNGEFFVNHVPLEEGDNIITANATDMDGYTATVSITVNAVTTEPYVTLRANIESGIAPLTTYFSVSTSIPDAVANYEIGNSSALY